MSDRSLLVAFVALVAAGAGPACGWLVATKFGSAGRVGRVRGGARQGGGRPPGQPAGADRSRTAGVIINGSAVPRSPRLAATGVDPWVERNRQVRRRDAVAGGERGYLL